MHRLYIRLVLIFNLLFISISFCFAQNCADISISGGNQTIQINNLSAPIEIVQVFDVDYNLIYRCEGTDCGDQQSINDLAAGTYQVNVQFYNANWQLICDRPTEAVTVLPPETGGNGNCEDLQAIGGEGTINITGLTAPIEIVQVFDKDYQIVFRCEGNDCGTTQLVDNLSEGLYRVNAQFYDANWQLICQSSTIEVNVSSGGSIGGGGDCDDLTINGGEGKIDIDNLTAPIEIVQVFDANYQVVFRCEGGDCGGNLTVDNLSAGLYRVNAQFYDANWQLLCTAETTEVTVTTGTMDNLDCSNVRVIGGETTIRVEGLTAPSTEVRIFKEGYSLLCRRTQDCGEAVVAENLGAGEYTVNVSFYDENSRFVCNIGDIIVRVNPDEVNIPSCEEVEITTVPNQIIVSNLNARAIVKVFTTSYEPVFECVDGDCNYPTQIIDLPPDFYNISIDLRDDNFNSVCLRRNVPITVPGNGCNLPDYPALVALHNATGGENWRRKWNLGDCNICDWEGITCDANGRVVELDLSSNGLIGNLTPAISGLEKLTKLNLSFGRISGSLPAELADLSALTMLDLRYNNNLEGCFPMGLCGIDVRFSDNQNLPFNGDFAQACATGLGFQDGDGDGFCDDRDCDDTNAAIVPMRLFSDCDDGNPNTINDKIQRDGCTCLGDALEETADCNTIQVESINNTLRISNLEAPRVFVRVFGENQSFDLFNCGNSGCEEEEIVLNNLEARAYTIKVTYQTFSGQTICERTFDTFVESTNCQHPDANALIAVFDSLGGANWREKWPITDCNPCSWYGVTCNEQGRVTEIDLSNNGQNGTIPPQIGDLTFLKKLNLRGTGGGSVFSFNRATTTIPATIGQLQQLEVLDLSFSTGYSFLPKEIGQLTNLKELNMFRAYFWGGLPEEFGDLINLEKLNLGYTYYEDYGSTPSSFGNLVNLKELNMTNSGIDKIPEGVYNFKQLEKLDLSLNDIEETLSPRLWGLTNLVELSLANNKFNGNLSDDLANLTQLKILNLSRNDFTTITSNLGNLIQLESLDLGYNELSNFPISVSNLTNLKLLNLSGNGIVGTIPPAYSNIGIAAEMVNLDFSDNQFTGCFPAELTVWCGDNYTVNFSRNAFEAGCNFLAFCEIGGPIVDADGDGLLATEDCNDNDPTVPASPRTPCEDGNGNTVEDLIQMNGCTCLGIPNDNTPPSCDLIQFFGDNAQLEIRGITTGNIHLKIFNSGFSAILFECLFNCEDQIIFPYPYDFFNGRPGLLNVEMQLYDVDESLLCSRRQAVNIFPNESGNRSKYKEISPIELFPNPARETITFKTWDTTEDKGTLQIFNLLGTTVHKEEVILGEDYTTINIQNLENGMYWLSLKPNNRRRISKRFIVEDWR